MGSASPPPGRVFALALELIALITPLAVHLFLPVIPAVKAALNLSDAHAQLTFSIALFGMAFATLVYGTLSDRYGRRPRFAGTPPASACSCRTSAARCSPSFTACWPTARRSRW